MKYIRNNKKRSASIDGVWNDENESELNLIKLKLREWRNVVFEEPERFSPETRVLIARVAAKCARMKDKRRYSEFVAILVWLEPLIEKIVGAELSAGNLTRREFEQYSKVLRDIEEQSLGRLQNLGTAG